jgi:serine/threonine protein kinase
MVRPRPWAPGPVSSHLHSRRHHQPNAPNPPLKPPPTPYARPPPQTPQERDGAHRHYVRQEILNHATLHHPHVVGFREAFLSRSHINIVMEYCSGGTILEFVQARHRLREPLARWFFQQLVVAVDYCHRKVRGQAVLGSTTRSAGWLVAVWSAAAS